MRTVIVLNGKPRAGKDTAIGFMRDACERENVFNHAFSSIEPVREAMTKLGIDVSQKTPEDRAALSEIGDTLERYYGFRSQACFKEIAGSLSGRDHGVVFMHMREPELIDKVASRFINWSFHKVYLNSKYAEDVDSNASDTGTWREGFYGHVLENNGSLDDLWQQCMRFLLEIGVLRQPPLLQ